MAPVLAKLLNKLSRDALIDLVLQWLQQNHSCPPYLLSNRRLFEADEEDYLHTPAESIEALRALYNTLRKDGSQGSKRDVIDRIIDGDWRRGLSLHQHATIDFAHLDENDTALRWSALRLVPLESQGQALSKNGEREPPNKKRKLSHRDHSLQYPHVSPHSFLSALKAEISPLVKAHYHLHRMPSPYNLTIIRLYITPNAAFDPGRSTVPRRAKQATDAGRVMYIALPDSCPYVYVSVSGSSGSSRRTKGARKSKGRVMIMVDMAAMKKVVLEAIPKALSRPQQRWALEPTKLTARSLRSMCELRGNRKPGTGGGAYSMFAEDDQAPNQSPADVRAQQDEGKQDGEDSIRKRFGGMAGAHHAALDRIHVKLENVITREQDEDLGVVEQEETDVGLAFYGTDVFLGLSRLAEMGSEYVDQHKMPAWMTGEMGVSSLTG